MKNLKTIFACLLMAVLSIGQTWGTDYYVKVTSAPTDWSGDYLIVYGDGNVAFNGGLTTLDANNNYIDVTISDNKIESNATTNAAKFTIASSGNSYTIKSASGYYIGATNNANSLNSNTSTAYTSSLTLSSGNVNVVSSGGAYLRFNSASNAMRFRYYKSSSYSSQKAIQFYKLESGSQDPSLTLDPTSWDFGTVATDANVSNVFTLSGSNLTAGDLTISVPNGYSVSPTSKSVSAGTLEATVFTVSKNTTTAGTYNGDFKIYGGGVAEADAATVALTMNVVAPVAVTGVTLNKNATSLEVGGTETLVATVAPEGATNKAVTWGSSDETVATVSNAGVVTASSTKTGTATITVTTEDGSKTATCDVTVTAAVEYAKVTSAPADWSGEYLLVYENSASEAYVWTGVDAANCYATATISNNKITKPSGAVKLTIASMEGGYSILISGGTNDGKYVGRKAGSNGMDFDESGIVNVISYSGGLTIGNNTSTVAKLQYYSNDKKFRYYTSSQKAVQLYKKAAPTHKFTYSIKSGDESKGGVTASVASDSQVEEGATVTLTPSANTYYQVASVSVNSGAVTVTENAGVYSFAMPQADAAAVVSFEDIPVTNVSVDASLGLVVGASSALTATVYPNTANPAVSWASDKPGIATVDANGEVTAVSVGTANITATSVVTGTVSGTCVVTVSAPTGHAIAITQNVGGTVSANVTVSDVAESTHVVLTATPDEGYSVNEWTVTGVTPTIDGATCSFSMPATNVTAQATFTHETATLVLSENGSEHTFDAGNTHYWKESVTLPEPDNSSACAGKVFVGWSADAECSTEPTLKADDPYVLPNKGENKLYAVYATPAAGAWTKVEIASISESDVIVVAGVQDGDNYYGLSSAQGTSSSPSAVALTVSENIITEGVVDAIKWNLKGTAGNYILYANGTENYLYNTASTTSTSGTNTAWRVGQPTSGTIRKLLKENGTTLSTNESNNERYLCQFNNADWRGYVNNTSSNAKTTLAFFKQTTDSHSDDYTTTCLSQVALPEFSGAEDGQTYTEAKTITITAEAGATIHYTINGNDPTESDDVFDSENPIELNSNGTYVIKAKAFKAGKTPSDVATLTVTIDLPLTTMDQIFAKASENSGAKKDVHITFDNWVVSGIKDNNAYVTDGTKGFIIYASNHGFAVNDKISGTVACKLELYSGSAEVTTLTASNENLTISKNGVITPVEVSIADLNGAYTGAPIIVRNVSFDGSKLNDANSNSITPYTAFYGGAVTDLVENKVYDVTGIYIQFNSTKEIAPRNAEDIDLQEKEAPTMAWYVDNTKEVAITSSYKVNLGTSPFTLFFETNSTGAVSYTSSNTSIATIDASTGEITIGSNAGSTTITASVAADDDYIADSKGFTLIVREAGPDFSAGDWTLVKDAAELTAGSYIIIAAADADVAMKSYESGNNCKSKAATKSGDMLAFDEDFGVFEITDDATYKTFQDVNTNKYLCAPSNNNYMKAQDAVDDNARWTITSVSAAGVAVVTNKGQSTRTIRFNDGNADNLLFACYASGQKDIALYKYYAPVPKITYDKNTEDAVTGLPGVQKTVWDEGESAYKATIAAGPSREGYEFAGWNSLADGSGNAYTVGTAYAFAENTTVFAQWDELAPHHVTYVTVGTAPTDANAYYKGDVVTLATDDGLSNPGYVFDGWNDGTATYAAGYTEYAMPDNDVTFTAVWSRVSNQKWVLVENVNDIKTDGTEYIIAGASSDVAMASLNGKVYNSTSVKKNGNILTGSDAMIALTFVAGSADGKYAIKHGTKYISSTTVKEMAEVDGSFDWTITIADGVASISASVGSLKYNSGAPRFTTYTSGQQAVAIYAKAASVVVNNAETVNVEDVAAGTDVTVKNGGVLNVNDDKQIGDLTVENGGKVVLSSNKLTVVGTFSIETTMASGTSGQLTGATAANFEAAEAYIDITLGAGATSSQWHAFTVPFPVEATSGVYDLDGNQLINETHYAIMEYFGDIRATGAYGWKKIRTTLQPGAFYIMTVDGDRTTYRFKKKDGAAIVAANKVKLDGSYTGAGDPIKDHGWNGVGNPNLFYGRVPSYMVTVLDPDNYEYYTYNPAVETVPNFVVGTPFFIQYTGSNTDFAMGTVSGTLNYAPAREKTDEDLKTIVYIEKDGKRDWLYVTASAEAENEYQMGKDLVKKEMSATPRVPRVSAQAYDRKMASLYTPLVNNNAEVDLNLYAPEAGEYAISTAETEANVYLTYEGRVIWDLTTAPYTIDLTKGNTAGYGLRIIAAPRATTDIEDIYDSASGVQKVMLDNTLYILRGEKMYDATGRLVK